LFIYSRILPHKTDALKLFYCFLFQLDNADEQAAQVRRELDSRLSSAEEMTKVQLWTCSIQFL
jgi:hypothetical protein